MTWLTTGYSRFPVAGGMSLHQLSMRIQLFEYCTTSVNKLLHSPTTGKGKQKTELTAELIAAKSHATSMLRSSLIPRLTLGETSGRFRTVGRHEIVTAKCKVQRRVGG